MANKPVLFTVDDDPQVLQAVERDLRAKFGSEYRVMKAGSGDEALDAVQRLKLRSQPVAMFLVDQRMPKMSGVEFLDKARVEFPDAKRVLLTAYADTDAAIKAINDVKLDYYLMKPWDPPEEHLYPVIEDLLYDWRADYREPYEGIRVIGHRWSPKSHDVKDFLSRNLRPYQWLDIESDSEAAHMLEAPELKGEPLPIIVFPDGTHVSDPTLVELANKVGLKTRTDKPFYDLIIVGGGPAGLAAAVYGASEGLNTVLIEREAPGGQAGTSSKIENYLGFPAGLSGSQLARRAVDQARHFGVEIITPQEVTGIRAEDPYRFVQLGDGSEIGCQALIIATGVSYRKLEAPGVEKLTGAGVYYGAAVTEAASTRDQDVYIVGGANSAGQSAVYLSRFARKVNILVRGDSIAKEMSQYLVDEILASDKIDVHTFSSVVEAHGEDRLESLTIKNSQAGETRQVPAAALFVFIGAQPRTDWVTGVLERDPQGFLLAGPDVMQDGKRPRGWNLDRDPYFFETNVPGIFVVGDVRHQSIKRIASAVGEGSMAVRFVHQYRG